MMKGWEASRGARLKKEYAEICKKRNAKSRTLKFLEYKKLERDGRLIVLPFPIRTPLYHVSSAWRKITEYYVSTFYIMSDNLGVQAESIELNEEGQRQTVVLPMNELDNDVSGWYTDKEKAEEKLKEKMRE